MRLVVLAVFCLTIMADVSAREPIAETDAFRFYSHFETNLNDALMSAGVDRNFDRNDLRSLPTQRLGPVP